MKVGKLDGQQFAYETILKSMEMYTDKKSY